MSWKIVDIKIWFDRTSYSSWLCEEKEKIEEMEMRMKRPQRGQKWKEKRNEKWKDHRGGKLSSE